MKTIKYIYLLGFLMMSMSLSAQYFSYTPSVDDCTEGLHSLSIEIDPSFFTDLGFDYDFSIEMENLDNEDELFDLMTSSPFTMDSIPSGFYEVVIQLDDYCTITQQILFELVNSVEINSQVVHSYSSSCNTGMINITPSGIAPYTYLWSSGETTSSISDLSPGEYSITVIDAECGEAVQSFTVNNLEGESYDSGNNSYITEDVSSNTLFGGLSISNDIPRPFVLVWKDFYNQIINECIINENDIPECTTSSANPGQYCLYIRIPICNGTDFLESELKCFNKTGNNCDLTYFSISNGEETGSCEEGNTGFVELNISHTLLNSCNTDSIIVVWDNGETGYANNKANGGYNYYYLYFPDSSSCSECEIYSKFWIPIIEDPLDDLSYEIREDACSFFGYKNHKPLYSTNGGRVSIIGDDIKVVWNDGIEGQVRSWLSEGRYCATITSSCGSSITKCFNIICDKETAPPDIILDEHDDGTQPGPGGGIVIVSDSLDGGGSTTEFGLFLPDLNTNTQYAISDQERLHIVDIDSDASGKIYVLFNVVKNDNSVSSVIKTYSESWVLLHTKELNGYDIANVNSAANGYFLAGKDNNDNGVLIKMNDYSVKEWEHTQSDIVSYNDMFFESLSSRVLTIGSNTSRTNGTIDTYSSTGQLVSREFVVINGEYREASIACSQQSGIVYYTIDSMGAHIVGNNTTNWNHSIYGNNISKGDLILSDLGTIIVGLNFSDEIFINKTSYLSRGESDVLIIEYSPNGVVLNILHEGGLNNEFVSSFSLDSSICYFAGVYFEETILNGNPFRSDILGTYDTYISSFQLNNSNQNLPKLLSKKKEDIDYIIFPNPTSNEVVVSFHSKKNSIHSLQIYDTQGNLVYNESKYSSIGKNQISISTKGFPIGVYNVILNKINNKKLVIIR